MHKQLSSRAEELLQRGVRGANRFLRCDVEAALSAEGCPPCEAFIDFITRFGGLEVRRGNCEGFQMVLGPSPEDPPPISFNDILFQDENTPGKWWLDIGILPIPLGAFMDESGAISLEGEDEGGAISLEGVVPIADSIETLLESAAIRDGIDVAGVFKASGGGECKPNSANLLRDLLRIPFVPEASDSWRSWWLQDDVAVFHELAWSQSDPPGPREEFLWVYSYNADSVRNVLRDVREVFVKKPRISPLPWSVGNKPVPAW
ncbi:MAG: hypothetical protein N2C14_23235 [Planctomycetales bacterium]